MTLKCNLSSYFAANYGPNPICKGCLSCSKDNGCIRCQHKLFFFLRREGMRQYGECLHSCPSGYYGLRTPDMNRCSSELFFEPFWTFLSEGRNSHSVFKMIRCETELYFHRYLKIILELLCKRRSQLILRYMTFSRFLSWWIDLFFIVVIIIISLIRRVIYRKIIWFMQMLLVLRNKFPLYENKKDSEWI